MAQLSLLQPAEFLDSGRDFCDIALGVASMRPVYARAYIRALEAAGLVLPGKYHIHDSEINALSAERYAYETQRGRCHAARGEKPRFQDTRPFTDDDTFFGSVNGTAD